MKKEDLKVLRGKSLKELESDLKKARDEFFTLKMDKITGKIKNLKAGFLKRKQIAVINTLIQEKNNL